MVVIAIWRGMKAHEKMADRGFEKAKVDNQHRALE
jgi:hypothetical protein